MFFLKGVVFLYNSCVQKLFHFYVFILLRDAVFFLFFMTFFPSVEKKQKDLTIYLLLHERRRCFHHFLLRRESKGDHCVISCKKYIYIFYSVVRYSLRRNVVLGECTLIIEYTYPQIAHNPSFAYVNN